MYVMIRVRFLREEKSQKMTRTFENSDKTKCAFVDWTLDRATVSIAVKSTSLKIKNFHIDPGVFKFCAYQSTKQFKIFIYIENL